MNKKWVKDSEVLDAFRESQDRIISIALIHEELHKVGGTDTLNFSSYIKKLVENLFHTYSLGNVDVSLNMDLEENILLDMDTAVPLGLIVNEMVSNSLKHAFPGRKTGEIRIKLFRTELNQYSDIREETGFENRNIDLTLIVSDNGVGIPEIVDIENPETLGLQLIDILVNQLDGKIEQRRENGTKFILSLII
ncbi:MAG: hypothetical protein QG646_3900 [Euryarchaeota archaeon]|nr:hypothetical protein [Euryarchaeota archaeon]